MAEGAGRGQRPTITLVVLATVFPKGGPSLTFSENTYVLYPNREISSLPLWCFYLLYKGNHTVSSTGGFHLPDVSSEAHRLESGPSTRPRLSAEGRSRLGVHSCWCPRPRLPAPSSAVRGRRHSDHGQAGSGHCSGCPERFQFRSNFREAAPDSKPSGINLIIREWYNVIYFGILFF